MINPYYSADRLKWEMLIFDEPDLGYEYNTLCFWNTGEGIYWAQDSGCSCPTPFEAYEGEDAGDIIKALGSPVKNIAEAKDIIERFNGSRHFLSIAEVDSGLETLRRWRLV